ncbi:MAG: hypothetical protein JW954_06190 [Dehalococcoidaceae bacterium]|nr:hypothetical protein [Dehalococcoidaceae bacterium]
MKPGKGKTLKVVSICLLAVCLAAAAAGCGLVADIDLTPGEISASALPPEANVTLELIECGGPFPYSRDGAVFYNYEGLLPEKPDGYYHEYTVVTPGESDRGARRIVAGAGGEFYYTDDHYNSFRLVVQ